jgi:predicted DNA-binding protein (MmcQ/YjbR family)
VFEGEALEKAMAAYAVELGGVEEKIKNPKNPYKNLRLFKAENEEGEWKIFLVIHEGSDPLVVDFLVAPEIAAKMIENYETAAQSNLLDKKRAVQLVLARQFEEADLRSFILQSQRQAQRG